MNNYDGVDGHWVLRLYVVGQDHKCRTALANLKALCKSHLDGHYFIEVVDLIENPLLAKEDEIIAVPTLVRKLPASIRKLVGDLSDTERTLVGLQLRPALPPVEQRADNASLQRSEQDDLGGQAKWLDEGGR